MAEPSAGQWQTVKSGRRRQEGHKKSNSTSSSADSAQGDPVRAAFAAIDSRRPAQETPASLGDRGFEDAGAFVSLQDEQEKPKLEPEAQAKAVGTAQKPPKQKKPKAKKVTPGQVSVDPEAFRQELKVVRQKYQNDHASQLGAAADYLQTTFKDCELPFNKTVLEQPLTKASKVPLHYLPDEIVSAATEFIASKPQGHVATLVRALLGSMFEGVPESAASTAPKAKVGLLIALALALRAAPGSLLHLCDDLAQGGLHYSSQRRLPFLLWALQQTASVDAGVALAVWLRVLLPQVLGAHLPSTAAAAAKQGPPPAKLGSAACDAALKYASGLLAAGREQAPADWSPASGGPGQHSSTVSPKSGFSSLRESAVRGISQSAGQRRHVEPVVPPGAVEAIVRSSFGTEPAFGPAEARIRLLNLCEELRDLALAGAAGGSFSCTEAVRLALDTAEAAPAPAAGSSNAEQVDQAARTLCACLEAAPVATTAAWRGHHRARLHGSTHVLQHLGAAWPGWAAPLAATAAGRRVLLEALQALRSEHARLLAPGAKAAQRGAAADADAAAAALQQRVATEARSQGLAGAASMLLLVAAAAATLTALARMEVGRLAIASFANSPAGEHLAAAVRRVAGAVEPWGEAAWDRLQPAWDMARAHLGGTLAVSSEQASVLWQDAQHWLQPAAGAMSSAARSWAARAGSLIHERRSTS